MIRNKKPDICFLNETHLTEDCDINDLRINGYNFISCNSSSKRTGGVCVFINKKIKYSKVNVISQQIAWYMSLEVNISKIPTILACVYLSASDNKSTILDSFEEWYEQISTGKQVVVCGDFNIDMLSLTTHARRLRNYCDDNGLKLLVDEPTRIASESKTMIDLCASNINKNKIECKVSQDDQISDHSLIEINICGTKEINIVKNRQIYVWNNYDKVKFWQSIESWQHTWSVVESKSINDKMDWLLNNLSESANQFKSIKTINSKPDFFDNELEQMRREKNRLYKTAQYSINNSNSSKNWQDYRQYKDNYKNKIRAKKYEINQRRLDRVKGDSKGTWKVLKSILNKENNEILCIKHNNKEYEDDYTIANEFNKFFVKSIVDLNTSIPLIPFEDDIIDEGNNMAFSFRGVSITDIKHCVREIKNNNDEFFLNSNVLLDAIFIIGQQLTNIINESFDSGIFPEALKKSTVVPIQKVNGTQLINEFRPINMLPCVEKLIEKLAYQQINNFVQQNDLLKEHQSGFRCQHSCETAINDVLYEWKQAQEESKVIVAVFLDLQRAFETIDTDILVYKLKKYGVKNKESLWFSSYLKNRRQIVKIGETRSEQMNNQLGVPQGSILGPLLFLLYINDIGNCLKYCRIKMFADDTLIYITTDRVEVAIERINQDLSLLFKKLCQNKLKLNINKTKAMILTNKKYNDDEIEISINEGKIEIVDNIKYLGVVIDNKLKMNKNIDYLCKKIGKKANIISRLRYELNLHQKLNIYKAIIHPHFIYCSSILYLANQTDISRLQKLQNTCMRHILKANRFTSSNLLLSALNLMNVRQTIMYYTTIFIHKIVNSQSPSYLTNRIKYRGSNHGERKLRNASELERSKATKSCTQNALFHNGIKLYNSIPNYIRNEKSNYILKKKLKSYIFGKF